MTYKPLIVLVAVALQGCATRGPITFDCELGNGAYGDVAAVTPLIRDIEGDTVDPSRLTVDGAVTASIQPLDRAIKTLAAPDASLTTPAKGKSVLLLSGGGQWGAFGAGYLQWLQRKDQKAFSDLAIITGISTGSLQALYLGALGTDSRQNEHWLSELARNYAPADEGEIVDRHSLYAAAFKGSVAGLKPLRQRVEEALCPAALAGSVANCPLIDALATAKSETFVGFVDAESGKFVIAHVNAIAKLPFSAQDEAVRRQQYHKVRNCLAGITIASAGVPAFYQQVRIKGAINGLDGSKTRTLYDGGTRHSVFEADFARRLALAEAARSAGSPPLATLYVLRNGPTTVVSDPQVQKRADALTAAQRGYSIIVNQSEVSAIASLRLARPGGPIFLTTADFHEHAGLADPAPPAGQKPDGLQRPVAGLTAGCHKPTDPKTKARMFDPEFMRCLQAFGRYKADRAKPWSPLCALVPGGAAQGGGQYPLCEASRKR